MSDDLVSRLRRAVTWQGVVPHGNELAREAADEIERLRAYTDAYNTLLAERVEVECLRGLAIRAWHSFRSGLTATGGCLDGLTDGDILELVRLSNTEAAKNLERDVLHDCRQGKQRCHECPDTECADNMRTESREDVSSRSSKTGGRSVSDPRERYDHNANNVTGTPVDEENDLVPIQLWREQQAEIERLRALLDGYEAMEKSMKQEASG